jgi:hypothetical protein
LRGGPGNCACGYWSSFCKPIKTAADIALEEKIKEQKRKAVERVKRCNEKKKALNPDKFKSEIALIQNKSYNKRKAIIETLNMETTRDKYISSGIVPKNSCVVCGFSSTNKAHSDWYIPHRVNIKADGTKEINHTPVSTLKEWKKIHPERPEATEDISVKVIKATNPKPIETITTFEQAQQECKKLQKALKAAQELMRSLAPNKKNTYKELESESESESESDDEPIKQVIKVEPVKPVIKKIVESESESDDEPIKPIIKVEPVKPVKKLIKKPVNIKSTKKELIISDDEELVKPTIITPINTEDMFKDYTIKTPEQLKLDLEFENRYNNSLCKFDFSFVKSNKKIITNESETDSD